MTDLSATIVPKSDQLNADDLIAGPRVIKVTRVALMADEQPIAIHYEGGDGKPYKPCKSMRRALIHCWGSDGNAYVGRRMALFLDPKVTFGKDAVGGIRISHLSDIDREMVFALTVTRGSRKPYSVKPLPAEAKSQASKAAAGQPAATLDDRAKAFLRRVSEAQDEERLRAIGAAAAGLRKDLEASDPELLAECDLAFNNRMAAFAAPPAHASDIDAPPEDPPPSDDAPAEYDTPAEWLVDAKRWIADAPDVPTLKALDKEWTDTGRWLALKAHSRADHDELLGLMNDRAKVLEAGQ